VKKYLCGSFEFNKYYAHLDIAQVCDNSREATFCASSSIGPNQREEIKKESLSESVLSERCVSLAMCELLALRLHSIFGKSE
jgi:hypothetical protein